MSPIAQSWDPPHRFLACYALGFQQQLFYTFNGFYCNSHCLTKGSIYRKGSTMGTAIVLMVIESQGSYIIPVCSSSLHDANHLSRGWSLQADAKQQFLVAYQKFIAEGLAETEVHGFRITRGAIFCHYFGCFCYLPPQSNSIALQFAFATRRSNWSMCAAFCTTSSFDLEFPKHKQIVILPFSLQCQHSFEERSKKHTVG